MNFFFLYVKYFNQITFYVKMGTYRCLLTRIGHISAEKRGRKHVTLEIFPIRVWRQRYGIPLIIFVSKDINIYTLLPVFTKKLRNNHDQNSKSRFRSKITDIILLILLFFGGFTQN